jgi:hypothetical protein
VDAGSIPTPASRIFRSSLGTDTVNVGCEWLAAFLEALLDLQSGVSARMEKWQNDIARGLTISCATLWPGRPALLKYYAHSGSGRPAEITYISKSR